MGTGTVSKFSEGNHQLWLFCLSERMKAVFLHRSWVCHARQAQAGGPRCSPAFLALPCRLSAHTATASARLPPHLEGEGFQQASLFSKAGVLLIFCLHVHISTWTFSLLGCTQTTSTWTSHKGEAAHLTALSVPTVCDPQVRIHHAAELTWSERGYRCPGSARGILPNTIPVLEETPDYRRKDSRSQIFISFTGIWNKPPQRDS